jgi:carbamoyl-phosphate synthase large subunit
MLAVARKLQALGFKIKATSGTRKYLQQHDVPADLALKLHEGRPSLIDDMLNQQVQLIINTPIGREGMHDDSYIRKAAIQQKIPYITTMAAALATAEGIAAMKNEEVAVHSLQEYQGAGK